MNEPVHGMAVMGAAGRLGAVDEVIYETRGQPARVIVRQDDGQSMVLQPGTYYIDGGIVHIASGGPQNRQAAGTTAQTLNQNQSRVMEQGQSRAMDLGPTGSVETRDVRAGEEVVIPVMREEVRVTQREVERGGVRVHKRVEEREEFVQQPAFREEVMVERVAIGRPIDQEIGSRQEGDTLIIPVLEEMLVVEKRLVLKEEVRITKRRVEETEQARVLLREEHVEIEELGDAQQTARGQV